MNCLLVEDDKDFYKILSLHIIKSGFNLHWANTYERALEILKEKKINLVIQDIKLGDRDSGLDLIENYKRYDLDIIVITAHIGYKEILLKKYNDGIIQDFFIKPFDMNVFCYRLQIMKEKFLFERNVKEEIKEKYGILGISREIQRVREKIDLIAEKDANVLIEGESGVGKELVARAIHEVSKRKGEFVPLNCSAILESLAESELFGIKKGSATGVDERKGKILLANFGTLFLDEISSMPITLQGKFLRVLEEKKFYPVGSDKTLNSDFRLISATNENIEKLVEEKKFRGDLYFRISTFKIYIPPLRERKEDIEIISKNFIKNLSTKYNEEKTLTEEAIEVLKYMEWKGNVRELQNFLYNLFLSTKSKKINSIKIFKFLNFAIPSPQHIPKFNNEISIPLNLKKHLKEIEKNAIEKALKEANGNIVKAAKLLSMPRRTFYRKLKYYKIKFI